MPSSHPLDAAQPSDPSTPEPVPGIAWADVSQTLAARRQLLASKPPTVSPDSLKRSVRAWTGQIVELTRRAEAAEAQVRQLQAQVASERSALAALGRRFGQLAHESFPAFVVRLGMMAKARPLAREPRPARASSEAPAPGPDTV
jgi:hypothetical protein